MKMLTILLLLSFEASAKGPFRNWLASKIDDRFSEKLVLAPNTFEREIIVNGKKRAYLAHVPRSYDPKGKKPLLLALHGGGGSMKIMAQEHFYKLVSKSEEQGFLVIFPNGYSELQSGMFATWNAGNCCGSARDKNIDDVRFIQEILAEFEKTYSFDKEKIFATGMSNGGMMAYRLACELPAISGIISVAGTDNTSSCSPSRPVKIFHIHAKDDDHVLYDGGAGKKAFRDRSKITEFTSVPATIKKWVTLNGCEETPLGILKKERVECVEYRKCKADALVRLCSTAAGGHSWPGGVQPKSGKDLVAPISATDEIWAFMNIH